MLLGEFKLDDIIDYLFKNENMKNNPNAFNFSVLNNPMNLNFEELCLEIIKRGSIILYKRYYFLLTPEEHENMNLYTSTIGFRYKCEINDDDLKMSYEILQRNDTCNEINNGIVF